LHCPSPDSWPGTTIGTRHGVAGAPAAAGVFPFTLQFDPSEIEALAAQFPPTDDGPAARAGAAAGRRGRYTARELLVVCSWKTPRSRPLVGANSPSEIARATSRALAGGVAERERMESLLGLRGVGVPTASVLLHFAVPEAYPILDVRALDSLGVTGRSTYPVDFWLGYLDACRSIASRCGVSLRTLDKALWQHSKERSGRP
jgi:hypothetical protein